MQREVHNLLEYPLRGGLPYRKAKRADIAVEAEWHRKLIDGNAFKLRFHESVMKQLRDERKGVEDVFTEERLQKLWKRAKE